MSRMWTLARREFRSYFDHATAYILVVAFLALGLFLAFRALYASGAASLRPFFALLPWLFSVFIPAITMRSLAEERRSGTLEWLMAQPLTELEVVAGKFVGNWLFALVALAGTLATALGVLLVSDADAGIIVAQYVGGALLAGQMVAIGLFASSCTRNQITSFILAVAVSFGLLLLGIEVVLIGLPPVLAAASARLSLISHFENVARGVIDLRDVLYFVSTAGLFLALAYARVAFERLSAFRGGYRRLRLGAAAIVVGVVVLNLLSGRMRGRIDLTADHLYTLSGGTREVLGELEDLVTIKLFVSRELPPEIDVTLRDVRDLLADFRSAAHGHVNVAEANPDEDEKVAEEASSFGIREIQFNVLRGDELQVKRGWLGLAVLYADKSKVIPVINRTDDLEYRLVSAVWSMTAERKPRIAFLTGFGARGAFQYSALNDMLEERFEVLSRSLTGDSVPPLPRDSFDVAVVAGPRERWSDAAVAVLRDYLDAGGAALILADGNAISPEMPVAERVETGLEPLLQDYGVRLASGMVYDLRSNERVSLGQRGIFNFVVPYALWPRVLPAEKEHPTTRGLEALSLAWASPLEIVDSADAQPLWTTTEFGGRRASGTPVAPDAEFNPSPDELAPQIVAVAVVGAGTQGGGGQANGEERTTGGQRRGRLVVVGDADFLEDQFAQANPQNAIFAANAIDWLAQDESLVLIRSKDRTPPSLVFKSDLQRNLLKWGNLIGVPLLFVGLGAGRVVQRRRRATQSREEVASS
ncbi:MAG: Gldg family protein [Gemmatimonadetes bacterium]|nr:Gldg family protein [Gemmatimonadota bacterium]